MHAFYIYLQGALFNILFVIKVGLKNKLLSSTLIAATGKEGHENELLKSIDWLCPPPNKEPQKSLVTNFEKKLSNRSQCS